jgi:hypothetical protein
VVTGGCPQTVGDMQACSIFVGVAASKKLGQLRGHQKAVFDWISPVWQNVTVAAGAMGALFAFWKDTQELRKLRIEIELLKKSVSNENQIQKPTREEIQRFGFQSRSGALAMLVITLAFAALLFGRRGENGGAGKGNGHLLEHTVTQAKEIDHQLRAGRISLQDAYQELLKLMSKEQ